jgi:glycosyltransferase involved in cell wall biosynthesis
MDSQPTPRISLIIPAFNEEQWLGKALDSVKRAKEAYTVPSRIEVIVVNNNSTDKTGEIARDHHARVVFEEKRCIAAVRNSGAASAGGEIVGFLDADSRVSVNIFNVIDKAMSSGEYIGGGTDIKMDRNSLGIYCTYFITKYPAMWLLGVMGGLIFTANAIFREIGGFDESLFCGEDMRFILDLKKYGKRNGKKFKVIKDTHVISSARAFDRFGDWYYFRNLPRIIRQKNAFRDREFCERFWYGNR